jgi:hypothetical protein
MTTHDNSRSQPGGMESRFSGQSLVNKRHVADPKKIVFLNFLFFKIPIFCKKIKI